MANRTIEQLEQLLQAQNRLIVAQKASLTLLREQRAMAAPKIQESLPNDPNAPDMCRAGHDDYNLNVAKKHVEVRKIPGQRKLAIHTPPNAKVLLHPGLGPACGLFEA